MSKKNVTIPIFGITICPKLMYKNDEIYIFSLVCLSYFMLNTQVIYIYFTYYEFLGPPVILNGTRAEQAATLVRMIDEWGIREYVTGQVCDTTASDMGCLRGAAAILERILGRPILWYGWRHHTGKLHIKHAYKA